MSSKIAACRIVILLKKNSLASTYIGFFLNLLFIFFENERTPILEEVITMAVFILTLNK